MDHLLDDAYADQPGRRVIHHLRTAQAEGKPLIGLYCCFAPLEPIWALGGVPVGLCSTSRAPIPAAETVLPANLCPLVKSSFGFILTNACPFFGMSQAVVCETTCDGKKKMFELIQGKKPMVTLELPQMPDEEEALRHWEHSVRKMCRFLEETFDRPITDEALEAAIREANRRRRWVLDVVDYARYDPPLVTWVETKDILSVDSLFMGADLDKFFTDVLARLEARRSSGRMVRPAGAPRVMVTGCPVGGDAEKVFHAIEDAGGSIVAQEACSGLKPILTPVEEGTGDPLAAIARRYFELPCSCMTTNHRRLTAIDRLIETFRPDAVIDVVLTACHTYNIESHAVREHVSQKHGLPFLKIETDYSESDMGQMLTRIQALLEMTA